MAVNREALALELKQIIQADRMAGSIISEADDTKRSIEKAADKEAAAILADAEKRKAEIERQVAAEQAEALKKRTAEMEAEFARHQDRLRTTVEQNSARWVDEITERIIKGSEQRIVNS